MSSMSPCEYLTPSTGVDYPDSSIQTPNSMSGVRVPLQADKRPLACLELQAQKSAPTCRAEQLGRWTIQYDAGGEGGGVRHAQES